jgi:DNA-binding transcriptional MerR regulator
MEYTRASLAHAAGMTERNVRAYQTRGLLPPPLRRGRTAVYGAEHVARLRLVRGLAAHGLSLRVIEELILRGTADDELARLARHTLPSSGGREPLVPMSAPNIESLERSHPGLIDRLVAAGLVERRDDEVLGSPTTLGLALALVGHGVGLHVSADVALHAARGAAAVRNDLAALVSAMDGVSDLDEEELGHLVVQLASAAFADVLVRQLVTAPRR